MGTRIMSMTKEERELLQERITEASKKLEDEIAMYLTFGLHEAILYGHKIFNAVTKDDVTLPQLAGEEDDGNQPQ